MAEEFGFSCCFCNQGIIENKIDPIDIKIMFNEDILNKTGAQQTFYAHFNCFKEKLHQYFKGYFIGDGEDEVIKNTKCLIQKIIELQSVDPWKVIYYGLERGFINSKFIMDYSFYLIEYKKSTDQFVIDIAALPDLYNIPKMVAEKANNHENIMIVKSGYYNKIWAYLSLATDMCTEKIIK